MQDAIAQHQLGIKNPTVAEGNRLVSTVMAAATAPLRFPGEPPFSVKVASCLFQTDPVLNITVYLFYLIKGKQEETFCSKRWCTMISSTLHCM